jgi:hypothetical protein
MVTRNIQKVIAFLNWLSVKQNLQESLEVVLYSSFWTLATNTFRAQFFFANLQSCGTGYKKHFIF